ncbi:UNVERIFIED_CONTAM: hypothetical protein RMT77_019922 [Armadillidium vulgare]
MSSKLLLCYLLLFSSYFAFSQFQYGNIDERGPYYQGDILLQPSSRVGINPESLRWPGGVVYYCFVSTYGKIFFNFWG